MIPAGFSVSKIRGQAPTSAAATRTSRPR